MRPPGWRSRSFPPPPEDGHFQDAISRVRAPVTYLQAKGLKAADFWSTLDDAGEILPYLWDSLEEARGEDVRYAYQAVVLARETRLRGIDHLHAHFATASTTVARLAARFARIPYTMTAHAKDIFHESVRPEDLRRKLQDAAATVTISDYNLEYLHDNYGPAAEDVRRIYNGLELERFPYEEPRGRVPEIVAVGRLVEKKGFADLIEACSLLRDRGVEVRCRIVGLGEQEPELRAAVERLGLGNTVELPGPRPQGDLIEAVGSAAVFAALRRRRRRQPRRPADRSPGGDGPGHALRLDGRYRHPRGAARRGDGPDGPPARPAALADAIERLLADPELRVRLAGRARRLVEVEFDVHRNAALLRETFEAAHAVAGRRAS